MSQQKALQDPMNVDVTEAIQCRCANGDVWGVDGVPCNYPTLTDAIQAANEFLADTFASGLGYTEEDIEVILGDTVLSLSEARQQLMAITLQEAGDVLEAIAVHGEYSVDALVDLAKSCRVSLRNYRAS